MRPGVTHPTHSRHFHSENVPDTSNSADTFDSAPRGKEKRRFRVRGCGGLSKHREPRESDASVRLRVRSHVPGTRRDRAPADEAGNKKAKLGIKLVPKESAYGPSSKGVRLMNRLRRTSAGNATLPAPRPEGPLCGRAARRGWDAGPAPGTCVASTPLNRLCGYKCPRSSALVLSPQIVSE
jgi:hypothetical protein